MQILPINQMIGFKLIAQLLYSDQTMNCLLAKLY